MSPRSGGADGCKARGWGASNQVRAEHREGGGAPGPSPGGKRRRAGSCPEVGVCIWVCPGCGGGGGRPSRGPEGGARRGGGSGSSVRPGAKGVEGLGALRVG